MRKVFLFLVVMVCFGSFVACGKEEEKPQTYVVEDILLGDTTYKEIKKNYPELCEYYSEVSEIWDEKSSMYRYEMQPFTESDYEINDVAGTMEFYYTKKGSVLNLAKFSPDELMVDNMSSLQTWLENQYADYNVSTDDNKHVTTWSNGAMDVELHGAARNETECSTLYIMWKLCD